MIKIVFVCTGVYIYLYIMFCEVCVCYIWYLYFGGNGLYILMLYLVLLFDLWVKLILMKKMCVSGILVWVDGECGSVLYIK